VSRSHERAAVQVPAHAVDVSLLTSCLLLMDAVVIRAVAAVAASIFTAGRMWQWCAGLLSTWSCCCLPRSLFAAAGATIHTTAGLWMNVAARQNIPPCPFSQQTPGLEEQLLTRKFQEVAQQQQQQQAPEMTSTTTASARP
jgi:hypothetical protein